MTFDDDELDKLLRRLPAPPVPPDTKARHLEQLRAAMAGAGADEAVERPLPRKASTWSRRRRLVVAITATGVVLVGGTAAATIAWERASVRNVVHCYPFPTTDFANGVLGPDVENLPGPAAHVAIPVCSAEWATGLISSTPPYTGNNKPGKVPPLMACVRPDGEVGVFPVVAPKYTDCADLGLPKSAG